jgi:predicted transglutaminase-like cysteine proteinase
MRKPRLLFYLPAAAILAFAAPVTELGVNSQAIAASPAIQLKIMETGKSVTIHQVKSKRRSRRKKGGRKARRKSSSASRAAPGGKSGAGAPLLFNSTETKSHNFKPFKKWKGAMKRMADEQTDLKKFEKRFKKWLVFLNSLKGKDKLRQIKEVNRFLNRSKYIQDNKNYGVKDYWASPGEFLSKFGDCEDYSIAKYMALKFLGFNPDNMRIVAVKDLNLKVGHAILAVYFKNRIVILDNQIKIVADSRKIRHYRPVYSINERNWWRHRAG